MKRSSRKYSKGGVLMVYSTQNTDEGGAEEAAMLSKTKKISNETAKVTSQDLKDDNNIKLCDLPENYFDDLLDLDFDQAEDLEPEKEGTVCQQESHPEREIKLIKYSPDMSSDEDDEKLIVKIRQNVTPAKQPEATAKPKPAKEMRDLIKIVLDKASRKANQKVPDDVSLKRPRGTSSPTDQQKIMSSPNKKAHISPIRAPAASPKLSTFQSTVHGTPQPIRALTTQYFISSQQLPQEAPHVNKHPTLFEAPHVKKHPTIFEALSLPYFVQQPANNFQSDYPQNCNLQSNHPLPISTNQSPPNHPGWPVDQHLQQPSIRCNIPTELAPVGRSNQIASIETRNPQPIKVVSSQTIKKLQQAPNAMMARKKAIANNQSAVVSCNSPCGSILESATRKSHVEPITVSGKPQQKCLQRKTASSDANISSQKNQTTPSAVSTRSLPSTKNIPLCSDKGVEVKPASKSVGVQCKFYCNQCNLYAKNFAKVTDLVMANEPHPVVRTRILKLLCFLHATANGQTDVNHPYKKAVSDKKLASKDQAAAASKCTKANQASEISLEAKLSQKGPLKITTAAPTLKPVSEKTGKIMSKVLPASSSSKTVPSSSSKDCITKGAFKNTPSKANVTQEKGTPLTTVPKDIIAKSVPAKKDANIKTNLAPLSSKPVLVAAQKLQSAPIPVDKKKTKISQQKQPIKIEPFDSPCKSSKESLPVLKIVASETKANPNIKNDVKVELSPGPLQTPKIEADKNTQNKPGASEKVSTEPSVENKKQTPHPAPESLQRGAKSKNIASVVTRGSGRGRFLAPRWRGSLGRGFIPRGRALRSRFPRASFRGFGGRGFAPPLHEPIHEYHEVVQPEEYHENDGDFSRDIGPNESLGQYLGPHHQEDPYFEPTHENHSPNFGPAHENHSPNFGPAHEIHGPNFEHAHEIHGPNFGPAHENHGPNFEHAHENHGPNFEHAHENHGPDFGPAHGNHGPNFEPMHSGEFQPNFQEDHHFRPHFGVEAPQFDAHGPPEGLGPQQNFVHHERGRGMGFRGGRGFCHNNSMGPEPTFESSFRGRPSPRFGMMRSRGRPPRHWN